MTKVRLKASQRRTRRRAELHSNILLIICTFLTVALLSGITTWYHRNTINVQGVSSWTVTNTGELRIVSDGNLYVFEE